MALTVKARVSNMERQGNQTRINFSAHYNDPVTGERVNQEWAEATPGFNTDMWVLNEVAEREGVQVNDNYLLTLEKEPDRE